MILLENSQIPRGLSKNDYFSEAISHPNLELEVVFGSTEYKNPIKKHNFKEVLEICKDKLKPIGESVSLDIRLEHKKGFLSNIRCSVEGMSAIKQYCKSESFDEIPLENVIFIEKKTHKSDKGVMFKSIRDEDYNLRLNLKEENRLDRSDPRVVNMLRDYSEKNISVTRKDLDLTSDKLFRIDLTVVKSTKRNKQGYLMKDTFKESNILGNHEQFELEIEYVGETNKSYGIPQIDKYFQMISDKMDVSGPNTPFFNDDLFSGSIIKENIGAFTTDELSDEEFVYQMDDDFQMNKEPSLISYRENTVMYSENEYQKLMGKNIRIKIWESEKNYHILKMN